MFIAWCRKPLNNLTRHSGAKEAWVRLRFLPQALEVEVEDHGKGFEAQPATQGIGLVAMRERAELLGGTVAIFAARAGGGGSGTLVRLTSPKKEARNLIRMPDKISVLLVDDQALVRRGFRRILEDEPDITVAGEASDGLEAVKLADELRPQVIVMDCAMPGMNGLEATRQILPSIRRLWCSCSACIRRRLWCGRRSRPARAATF